MKHLIKELLREGLINKSEDINNITTLIETNIINSTITNGKLLTESEVNELMVGLDTKSLLAEFNEGEGELITESVVTSVLSLIKTFLTTHRVGELVTSLVKLINSWLGIDKDMNGLKDKCEDDDDSNDCKMWVQKLSDLLHNVHHKIMDVLGFVVAVVKYKTFKPSKEQKDSVKDLAHKVFNAFIIGCLVYYTTALGLSIKDVVVNDGSLIATIIPTLGVIAKVSDLSKVFNSKVSEITNGLSTAKR